MGVLEDFYSKACAYSFICGYSLEIYYLSNWTLPNQIWG
jgi:hypothetical protein